MDNRPYYGDSDHEHDRDRGGRLIRAELTPLPDLSASVVVCQECQEAGTLRPISRRAGAWWCPTHKDLGHVVTVEVMPVAEHEAAMKQLRDNALSDLRARDGRQSYWLLRALTARGKPNDLLEEIDKRLERKNEERGLTPDRYAAFSEGYNQGTHEALEAVREALDHLPNSPKSDSP